MFLVFAGDRYYPAGGWDDYIGGFDTIESAEEALWRTTERYDWGHIVDLSLGEIIER